MGAIIFLVIYLYFCLICAFIPFGLLIYSLHVNNFNAFRRYYAWLLGVKMDEKNENK